MSDKRFNNNPSDDFYLDKTVDPERYRHVPDRQTNPSRPLFADDDDIPTFDLGEDYGDEVNNESYGNGAGDIYINRPYRAQQPQYQQPQYQQPQYQQPTYRQQQRQQPPRQLSPSQRQLQKQQQSKQKEKKKHRLLKALFITPLVILLTVGIAVAALAFGIISKVDYNQVDLEQNQYVNSNELHSSKSVINILFVGIDDDEGGNSRSDSMMLVSVDKKHKKIKLTSFLRDSWVDLPMKGKKAKLNAAYAANGIQGAVDTIEYNFGIDIDHYVMVDFEMFVKVIDAIGGVEVEVTEKEAKFIRQTTRYKNMQSGEKVRLSGAEALVYCRIRKLDSDYMRTYRQRKVITALIDQAKQSDIKTLIDAMYDVFPLLQTDLDKGEVLAVGMQAGYGLLSYEIQQTRVPIDEHMTVSTINGQWVEVLDLDKVREYLYDFLYTDKIKFDDGTKEG